MLLDLILGSYATFMARSIRASSRNRLTTSPPLPSLPSSYSPLASEEASNGDSFCHFPFKSFHGCTDGVKGRGYAKGSIIRHLHDKHLSSEVNKEFCGELIVKHQHIQRAWEKVLMCLRMWLYCRCMHLHAWSMSCNGKEGVIHGDVVSGPLNGEDAEYLFHGLAISSEVNAVCSDTSNVMVCVASEVNDGDVAEEPACPLSTELLNSVFQRQFTTVTCIPHQCRLSFSRTLKFCLDKVILNPANSNAWLQLISLPIFTLALYRPKNSAEEKSGKRKRLQVAAINHVLSIWKEPNGCRVLVEKCYSSLSVLGLSKKMRRSRVRLT
ncbi:uncharacterized protein LOC113332797 [Papaver somniferum]|uniref:uncharacterized protein LOC113332797 n=1 Tax=Papaver somniferum TaxID=3469 RepID=UPI000E701801|nr:uncharacterized protein LOC113332797 [Papaver somniferum]